MPALGSRRARDPHPTSDEIGHAFLLRQNGLNANTPRSGLRRIHQRALHPPHCAVMRTAEMPFRGLGKSWPRLTPRVGPRAPPIHSTRQRSVCLLARLNQRWGLGSSHNRPESLRICEYSAQAQSRAHQDSPGTVLISPLCAVNQSASHPAAKTRCKLGNRRAVTDYILAQAREFAEEQAACPSPRVEAADCTPPNACFDRSLVSLLTGASLMPQQADKHPAIIERHADCIEKSHP